MEGLASGRHCASEGLQAEVAPWGGMMNLKGKGFGGGGSKRKAREMPKAGSSYRQSTKGMLLRQAGDKESSSSRQGSPAGVKGLQGCLGCRGQMWVEQKTYLQCRSEGEGVPEGAISPFTTAAKPPKTSTDAARLTMGLCLINPL